MASVSRKFRTALRMPLREKAWFVALYPLSGVCRLATLVLPFRWVSRFLGRRLDSDEEVWAPATPEEEALAWRLGRVCELVSRYTPWECKCLVQSMMARVALGCSGIPWVIRIGVGRGDGATRRVQAHAWTQVGGLVVTGGKGHRSFSAICVFGSASAGRG